MSWLMGVGVCLLTGTAMAAPTCKLTGRPWLEGRLARQPLSRAVDAKLGEAIEVFVVAPGRLGGRAVLFSEANGRNHVSWAASGCASIAVSWRRVEPRMQHVSTPAPNTTAKVYANAVVFGPDHGSWLGFDKIEYFETALPQTGWSITVRDAAPSEATGIVRSEASKPLGTMRLAATVGELATPDASDAPDGLIAHSVFRYSFRTGDTFLGWLSSYFNVPYLFGSAGKGARNQAERYVGADCADVLVAALRRAGHPKLEYSSVAGLVDSLDKVSGPVQPGDFYALDYVDFTGMPKSWDHIVALVEDRGPDGKPDGLAGPDDLVIDSGDSSGLKVAPLADQGKVRIEVLRAKATKP